MAGRNSAYGPEQRPHWRFSDRWLRQFKLRSQDNVSAVFGLHVIAYNLIRLGNLLLAQPSPQE